MDMRAETFSFLFQKLNKFYNFNPVLIIFYYDLSLRKGIKMIFPNIKFFG